MNKAGSIRKANLVMYIPEAGKITTALPDKTFYNILNEGKNVASGQFRFLSVAGRWLYQLDYNQNGDLSAFGLIQQKSKLGDGNISTNDDTTLSTCTDWYLVTTYYYSDGSTSQTSEYVGTTCSGCGDTMNQSLCPEGDSGGSTSEYEFAYVVPKEWEVNAYSPYWNIHSIEDHTGKKVSTEPQGGHFIDVKHKTSFLYSGTSLSIWSETSSTASLDDIRTSHCYIWGRIRVPSIPWDEPIYNEKTWNFNQVF
jgi:hypothetical protein